MIIIKRIFSKIPTRFAVALMALSAFAFSPKLQAAETLEVGYIPIIPMSQLFVMEGEGWTEEAGLNLELTRFSSGPAIVQALASGQMDAVYFGIGPAMVARSKGIDVKVVAAGIAEQIAVIARGELEELISEKGAKEGILAFQQANGRPAKIATLPKGSVPDTVGRHWLFKKLGLTQENVELVGMGANRVQQALLAGSVDAASILEPILTIVESRVPDASVVARAADMLENQPGSVLAVRESALRDKPDAVKKLVELHIRATRQLQADPKGAAVHVQEFIGKGLIPLELMEKAMTSPSSNFIANPRAIIDSTRAMSAFQAEIGVQKGKVDLDELFTFDLYDAALQ